MDITLTTRYESRLVEVTRVKAKPYLHTFQDAQYSRFQAERRNFLLEFLAIEILKVQRNKNPLMVIFSTMANSYMA